MVRDKWTVSERFDSLAQTPPQANFTLFAVRDMYLAGGGQEFHCTIGGYCRTRVFEFPRIDLHLDIDEQEPHHTLYSCRPVQACVTTELVEYFQDNDGNVHYHVSPSLRYEVAETERKIRSQQKDSVPAFLVLQEFNDLQPVEMNKGECSINPEVSVRNGEKVPILVGGRVGEEFITAWHTVDGAWPQIPNNDLLVNMILAGVRAGQQTADPIRKYLDHSGLVTVDGRFVEMLRPSISVRGSTATPMDSAAYRERLEEIRKGIGAIELAIDAPHMALLVNSMYSDEYKDDAYRRLHYLSLWQSLQDAGKKYLGYQGKSIKYDHKIVAGTRSLNELTNYRNYIAHWLTDCIDENYLADLQRTINELLRRKYFRKN